MDDMSTEDDTSSDTLTDMGTDDSGTGDTPAKETDTQSSDPTTILFEVMRLDPSLETIIYRLKTEKLLQEILANPPVNMSSQTLKMIEIWLTQWLFIVAPSVTQRFLSLKLQGVK